MYGMRCFPNGHMENDGRRIRSKDNSSSSQINIIKTNMAVILDALKTEHLEEIIDGIHG